MNKSPSYQLYVKDRLSDADLIVFSGDEYKVFDRLTLHCWNEEGLRTDPKYLAALSMCTPEKFEEIWLTIGRRFEVLTIDGREVYFESQLLKTYRLQKEKPGKTSDLEGDLASEEVPAKRSRSRQGKGLEQSFYQQKETLKNPRTHTGAPTRAATADAEADAKAGVSEEAVVVEDAVVLKAAGAETNCEAARTEALQTTFDEPDPVSPSVVGARCGQQLAQLQAEAAGLKKAEAAAARQYGRVSVWLLGYVTASDLDLMIRWFRECDQGRETFAHGVCQTPRAGKRHALQNNFASYLQRARPWARSDGQLSGSVGADVHDVAPAAAAMETGELTAWWARMIEHLSAQFDPDLVNQRFGQAEFLRLDAKPGGVIAVLGAPGYAGLKALRENHYPLHDALKETARDGPPAAMMSVRP